MAIEIEHKYLVKDMSFKKMAHKSYSITQGYLSREKGRTVRVRVRDDEAYVTIKSGRTEGFGRQEYEYRIPVEDGRELMKLCPAPVIEKTRYLVDYAGNTWEIDVFHGDLDGLVIAEIELNSEDQQYEVPPFVGENVTGDSRYSNSRLGLGMLK